MTYGTTNRLPTIVTYEAAKKLYERVKPIRGSEKDVEGGIRPMAARRDKHLFIRKGVESVDGQVCYELVCYQSPVITIHPDDRIVIQPYYQSSYTCDFIRNILWNTRRPSVRNTQGKTLIEFHENEHQPARKYLLARNDKLTLRYNVTIQAYETIEQPNTYVWTVNRKKLNAALRPYSDFAKYYQGMLSLLLVQAPDDGLTDDPFVAKQSVTVQMDTLVNLLGTVENPYKNHPTHLHRGYDTLNTKPWATLMSKPTWATLDMVGERQSSHAMEWRTATNAFLTSVRNDQPEAEKYENFQRAAFGLFVATVCAQGRSFIPVSWPNITLSKTSAMGAFREFALFVFAEEVMEKVPSKPDTVPTTNYGRYLFGRGN